MSKRPKEVADALQQTGSILVEGPTQARFWIRALQLQNQIGQVQALIQAKPERKQASVPAIGHYVVDDKLKWIYALHFTVDALGVDDVIGKVWFASPKYEQQVFKARDELGDHLIRALEERNKNEQGEYFDIEFRQIEAKKESGIYENHPDQ